MASRIGILKLRRRGSPYRGSLASHVLVTLLGVVVLAGVTLVATRDRVPPPSAEEIEARTLTALAGVPQDGALLGDPAAQMTLSIYTDLRAISFSDFVADGLPVLVERYVRTGRMKIRLSPLPSGEVELDEAPVARLANSIGLQDRMWQFASVFPARYLGFAARYELELMAGRAGANVPAAFAALNSSSVTAALAADQKRVRRYRAGPSPQPLYIVDPPIGAPREVRLPAEAEDLVAMMNQLLRQ